MKYLTFHLGLRDKGECLDFLIGNTCNVRLMTKANYDKYVKGEDYDFIGGPKDSNCEPMEIPYDENWKVVLDTQGLPGDPKGMVRIIDYEDKI